jgi:hypothetical protein
LYHWTDRTVGEQSAEPVTFTAMSSVTLASYIPKIQFDESEKSFDIEKVTKEFLHCYKDLYDNVRDELNKILKKNTAVRKDLFFFTSCRKRDGLELSGAATGAPVTRITFAISFRNVRRTIDLVISATSLTTSLSRFFTTRSLSNVLTIGPIGSVAKYRF